MLDRLFVMTKHGLVDAETDFLPEGSDSDEDFHVVMRRGDWFKDTVFIDAYDNQRATLWSSYIHGKFIIDLDLPFDNPSFILCRNVPMLLEALKLLQPSFSLLGIREKVYPV